MDAEYQVESYKTCFFIGVYIIKKLTRDELENQVK
jgi:hypothetical protein